MRYIYIILFIFTSVSSSFAGKMGGNISWKCIGNDSIKVELFLYQECTNNSQISSIEVIKVTSNANCIDKSIILDIENSIDVTPLCAADCNTCESSICTNGYGVKKSKYSAYLNLSGLSTNCCKITLSHTSNYRQQTTTLYNSHLSSQYLESMISLCDLNCVSAPDFIQPQTTYLCNGRSEIKNMGYEPEQAKVFDSIQFSLQPPLRSANNVLSYKTPYSEENPYCDIKYDPQPNFFPNIELDNKTGITKNYIINNCDLSTIYRIKSDFYLEGKINGYINRDILVKTINCDFFNYDSIKFSGFDNNPDFYTKRICPGDKFDHTIYIDIPEEYRDFLDLNIQFNDKSEEFLSGFDFEISKFYPYTINAKWIPDLSNLPLPGIYEFEIIAGSSHCIKSPKFKQKYKIEIRPTIKASDDITICRAETIELSSGIGEISNYDIKFLWLPDSQTTNSIMITADTVSQYILTATHPLLCNNTDTIDLNIKELPLITTDKNFISCEKDTLIIEAKAIGGTQPYEFNWLPFNSYESDLHLIAESDIIIKLKVSDQNGCKDEIEIYSNVFTSGNINAGENFNLCENSPAKILEGTPVGGKWSGTGISENYFDPAISGTGEFSLIYSLLEPFGCNIADTLKVTVFEALEVNIGSFISLCNTNDTLLISEVTGGKAPYFYQWGPVDHNENELIVEPKTTSVFKIKVTDINSCTGQDEVTVFVPENIIFEIEQDTIEICQNESAIELNISPEGGIWEGIGMDQNVLYPELTEVGLHFLTYTYKDEGNCEHLMQIPLIVKNTPPDLDAGQMISICLNDNKYELDVSEQGTEWAGEGVIDNVFYTDKVNSQIVTLYKYLEFENGCFSMDSTQLEILAVPEAVKIYSPQTTITCEGNTLTLESYYQHDTYLWSNGSITPEIEVKESGYYFMTAYNQFGCSNTSDSIKLEFFPNPKPEISGEKEYILCIGDTITINAENGFRHYLWNIENSTSTIQITQAGKYFVHTVNQYNCKNHSDTIFVASYPKPEIETIYHENNKLRVNVNPSDEIDYQWYFNDKIITGATEDVVKINEAGAYSVVIIYKDLCSTFAKPFIISEEGFILYPNPTDGILLLDANVEKGPILLQVFDINGKLITYYTFENGNSNFIQKEIDLREFDDGLYYIIILVDNELIMKKVIKAR